MTKKINIRSTMKDAANVEKIWQENPNVTMGDLKLADYVSFHAATQALDKDCAQRDLELTGLKVQRENKIRQLQNLVVRFRSGMISHFGSDSAQYEQAGGIRYSVRKAPARKPRPEAQAVTPSHSAQPEHATRVPPQLHRGCTSVWISFTFQPFKRFEAHTFRADSWQLCLPR